MPSDYIKDLVDHKQRVAGYLHMAVNRLLELVVNFGDAVPYPLETGEDVSLIFMIGMACKIKRDGRSVFVPSGQLATVIAQTIERYLAQCDGDTPYAWVGYIISDIFQRAVVHDNSKFSPEEFEAYEAAFPELQRYAYGTEEFKSALRKIKPAIAHHYQANDHHPEHFEHGVVDMHLVQLFEMVCDWLAASERSQTDFVTGLEMNKERFHIDDQLFEIIKNTARWCAPEKFPEGVGEVLRRKVAQNPWYPYVLLSDSSQEIDV